MTVLSNFAIEQQNHDQWCWAAVCISVFRFFNDQRWKTQCALVNDTFNDVLAGNDCCQNGASDDCDRAWDIGLVLFNKGHMVLPQVSGPMDFDALTHEISNNRSPVVIRVQFDDGVTDHFVAIVGCALDQDGRQIIQVADPSGAAGNCSTLEFENFPENYRPGTTWVNCYRTKTGD
jgi:hypothetical protein